MKKSILSLLLLVGVANGEFLRDEIKEVVLDTTTNLMWQDNNETIGETNKKTWTEAINYCEDLSLGGFNNWRLPNYNELYALADRSTYNPAISDKFINIASSDYWSSTTYASNSDIAWFVYFNDGGDGANYKTDSRYVRCVRDGQ